MFIRIFFFFMLISTLGQAALAQNISGIINSYAKVLQVNTESVIVNTTITTNFEVGDMAMLIQMNGALIDETNTDQFGTILNYQDAGNYEFLEIVEVLGDEIFFACPLVRTYDPDFAVQLVRVPVYQTAIAVDVLTAAPWNGETGGVFALFADTLQLDYSIDVSGLGFRGGDEDQNPDGSCSASSNTDYFYDLTSGLGAEKGEGIVTYIPGKDAGRGRLGNGGGGGNKHNSGGGGGSNYSAGGQGGFQADFCPSIDIGGQGGQGLLYPSVQGKAFMGGGGGCGNINNAVGTVGGNGGGIVFILTFILEAGGNAGIHANGTTPPPPPSNEQGDGGGGGGAGGSILVNVGLWGDNQLFLEANGGNGGNPNNIYPSCFGPGGGGGSGVVWISGDDLPPNISVDQQPGSAGINQHPNSSCLGQAYGATNGEPSGDILYNLQPIIGCNMPPCPPPATNTFSGIYSYDSAAPIQSNIANAVVQNSLGQYAVLGKRGKRSGAGRYDLTFNLLDETGTPVQPTRVMDFMIVGEQVSIQNDLTNVFLIETFDIAGNPDGYAACLTLEGVGSGDVVIVRMDTSGCVVWSEHYTEFSDTADLPIGLIQQDNTDLLVFIQKEFSGTSALLSVLRVSANGGFCEHIDYQENGSLTPNFFPRAVTELDSFPHQARYAIAGNLLPDETNNSLAYFFLDENLEIVEDAFVPFDLDPVSQERVTVIKQDGNHLLIGGQYLRATDFPGFLVKIEVLEDSISGNLVWAKEYEVSLDPENTNSGIVPFGLEVLPTGNYALSGVSYEFPNIFKGFLLEVSHSGNPVWEKLYYGNGVSVFSNMIRTADGGFLMVGLEEQGLFSGEENIYIVKTDEQGNLENCDCYEEGATIVLDMPGMVESKVPMSRTPIPCSPADVQYMCTDLSFLVDYCDQSPPSCLADFNYEINDCGQVIFTDASNLADGVTWDWTFPGGDPSSSNEQNPVVNYPASGTYTACLMIDNGSDSCMKCDTFDLTFDVVPPVALCVNTLIVELDENCTATITPQDIDAGSFDNCGIESYTLSQDVFNTCGIISVTLTVVDFEGNTDECTTTRVIIQESVPPVFAECPDDFSVQGAVDNNGICTGFVFLFPEPTVTDNCGSVSIDNDFNPGGTPTGNYPPGPTTVTFTATDDCQNTSTCEVVVTVICGPPPACEIVFEWTKIDCISAEFTPISLGDVPIVSYAWDVDCDDVIESTEEEPVLSFDVCGEIRNVCLTVEFEDGTVCTFEDQVVFPGDFEAPVVECPPLFQASTDPGVCFSTTLLDVIVSDNCDTDPLLTYEMTGATVGTGDGFPPQFELGDTEIILTAIDICGNVSDSCTSIVHIRDMEAPMLECPPNVNIEVPGCFNGQTVNYADAMASDNCGLGGLTYSILSGSFFPCGATTVTVEATDIYGNSSTCNFQVAINGCESCAVVIEQELVCGAELGQYDFALALGNLTSVPGPDATISVDSPDGQLDPVNLTIAWPNISGTLFVDAPPPANLTIEVSVTFPCAFGDITCTLPVTFSRPCCEEVLLEDQQTCSEQQQLVLSLGGDLDFLTGVDNLSWYVAVPPCDGYNLVQQSAGMEDLILPLSAFMGYDYLCVYAELAFVGGAACNTLVSNTATITLCDPVSGELVNNNGPYCSDALPGVFEPIVFESGNQANCDYTIQWIQDNQTVNGATSDSYVPTNIGYTGGPDECLSIHPIEAEVTNVCGTKSIPTVIEIYNVEAPEGGISIISGEDLPICPGEDLILAYAPACIGPENLWEWCFSTDDVSYQPLEGSGQSNPQWWTNPIIEDIWFKVKKQNGVCPQDEVVFLVEVWDNPSIESFTAVGDENGCETNEVLLDVDFLPAVDPGCPVTAYWYKNGMLLAATQANISPVSYLHTEDEVAGNYYAILENECCGGRDTSEVVRVEPGMSVSILAPCFRCNDEEVELFGEVENPPEGSVCMYQWFLNGEELEGETNQLLEIDEAGVFTFQATCGDCEMDDTYELLQCGDPTSTVYVVDPVIEATLWPNPTADQVYLSFSGYSAKNALVHVVNQWEQSVRILPFKFGSQQVELSLAQLPAGIYFLKVVDSGQLIWVGKLIKQ